MPSSPGADSPSLAQVRESMAFFDKDGTGKVPVAQLNHILQSLGSNPLSQAELGTAISQMRLCGGEGTTAVIDQSDMVDTEAFAAWSVASGRSRSASSPQSHNATAVPSRTNRRVCLDLAKKK